MSDPPTFANLLTQWSTGGPSVRQSLYAHFRASPAEAAAVEAFLRDELNANLPWRRVIAAEAMVEVYRDEAAATAALAWVLRHGNPAAVADSVEVLRKLPPECAGPLLADFALLAPKAFASLTPEQHRWAGATAARCGERGAATWLAVFAHADASAEPALLMGLADAAGRVTCDFTPVLEVIRTRLFHERTGYAAGGALWRLTWRVHRDWLESINPDSPRFENDPLLLAFLIDVLSEHLGRRPDLAPVVRALLVRLAADVPEQFDPAASRLATLGARGWSVLLPVLGDTTAPAPARESLFRRVGKCAPVRQLAQHSAHCVILARAQNREAVPDGLLAATGGLLYALGRAAESAAPDVLDLIVKQPDTTPALAKVFGFIGFWRTDAAALLVRTLDRLRRSVQFDPDAFAALARQYAALNLDGVAGLIENTGLDPRTAEGLLQQPAWKDAPPEVRRRHAAAFADRLGSPRPEVRARAADALRHYADQLSAAWPALVALLAGPDEKTVLLTLSLFRHLGPAADAVTAELRELFREPNPAYAARAVVALWRLGRLPLVADELRDAVTAAPDGARAWSVLRGVADRAELAHELRAELTQAFATAPPDVAAKAAALLNPPELQEELALAAHVPSFDPTGPRAVNWAGVVECVGTAPEGGLLFLALMCAFGAEGEFAHKIWLIKHHRTLTGAGLGQAKLIVERAMELTASATPGEKRAVVRDFLPGAPLPKAATDLLAHRLSWYRWAGLELLDAWGAPERLTTLIAERAADRSALVRMRALRMNHG